MRALAFPLLIASATPAMAQVDDHAGHEMPPPSVDTPSASAAPRPAPAEDYAADAIFGSEQMEQSRRDLVSESGGMKTFKLQFDMLEARIGNGRDGYHWDATASYGGDIGRITLKSEGDGTFDEPAHVETQLLWTHAVSPWFDLQAGARYDAAPGPDRAHAVLGVAGLAPYNVEIEATAFLSDKGEVAGRLKAEHDMRITQSLIAQPLVEVQLSARDIPELGVGAGVSSLRAGIRLRYEIERELAPYIGIEWLKKLGKTARYVRDAGDDPDRTFLVAGLRFWF